MSDRIDEETTEYGASPPADDEHVEAEESTDLATRARGPVAVIIILLILMMTICVTLGTLTRFQLSRAQFLARNAECLVCHTEVLEQMKLDSQHQPFISEHCTSCHTPHGRYLEVRQRNWFASTAEGLALWLRWGPFRWLLEERDGGNSEMRQAQASTTSTRSGLGPSKLKAPLTTLCWSCHPGIAPDRKVSEKHVPFVKSNCTSCHNPHASNYGPILIGEDRLLCGQCHPMVDLARQHTHQPAQQWQCRSCHRAHGSNHGGMLVDRQRIVCFSCHPEVAQDDLLRVKHQPFVEECTGCHEPHGADAQPLLIKAEPELCYLCHPDTRSEFSLTSHHPVPGKIMCTDCHRAHASSYEAILVNEEKPMCLGCHTTVSDLRMRVFQHVPFEQKKCTVCHKHHGSKYGPLLDAPEPTLCYNCHPSVRAEFQMKSHHPIGKKLVCTGCHQPHASGYWALLHTRGNRLCYRCHDPIRPVFQASLHHGLDCVRCHKWHGSDYEPLLQKLNPPLCLDCHEPNHFYSGPRAHPTWPSHWDWRANKPLTCTSTCHNAHGTKFEHMVRRYDPDWDGQCRQCHDDVGVWY